MCLVHLGNALRHRLHMLVGRSKARAPTSSPGALRVCGIVGSPGSSTGGRLVSMRPFRITPGDAIRREMVDRPNPQHSTTIPDIRSWRQLRKLLRQLRRQALDAAYQHRIRPRLCAPYPALRGALRSGRLTESRPALRILPPTERAPGGGSLGRYRRLSAAGFQDHRADCSWSRARYFKDRANAR